MSFQGILLYYRCELFVAPSQYWATLQIIILYWFIQLTGDDLCSVFKTCYFELAALDFDILLYKNIEDI